MELDNPSKSFGKVEYKNIEVIGLQGGEDRMDEQIIKTKKNRKSLIDRLLEILGDKDTVVITKGKLSKIKEKFNEPKTVVNERYDGFGDDCEEEIINETKTKRSKKTNPI